jgi:hypothetical protein
MMVVAGTQIQSTGGSIQLPNEKHTPHSNARAAHNIPNPFIKLLRKPSIGTLLHACAQEINQPCVCVLVILAYLSSAMVTRGRRIYKLFLCVVEILQSSEYSRAYTHII